MNANEIAVTYREADQTILFISFEWGGQPAGAFTDFRDFRFGKTTLDDIRVELGHNGMAYEKGPTFLFDDAGNMVTSNAYELVGRKQVVIFATKLSAEQIRNGPPSALVGAAAKLDTIMLADSDYLDAIWGSRKMRDQGYGPVPWSSGSDTSPPLRSPS